MINVVLTGMRDGHHIVNLYGVFNTNNNRITIISNSWKPCHSGVLLSSLSDMNTIADLCSYLEDGQQDPGCSS